MLTLHREVEICIQAIIVADKDIVQAILAILTLLYAIIQISKPVLLFAGDVFGTCEYMFKMVSIVFNSVAYGVT